MTWPRTLAYLLAGSALAMALTAGILAVRWPGLDVTAPALAISAALPAVVLGSVIASKRPANKVAPLLVLVGAIPIGGLGLGEVFAEAVRRYPGDISVSPLYAGFAETAWMWLYVPAALLLLLFPDGRLPGRKMRWVAGGLLAVPVLFAVLGLGNPEPHPVPFDTVPSAFRIPGSIAAPAAVALLVTFLGLLIASATAMIVRYRGAIHDPQTRSQLRVFALGALSLPITLLLCWIGYLLWGGPDLAGFALTFSALALSLAVGVALLRHDLYGIDRMLSATVTYACLATVLLAGFGGAAVLSGVLLGRDSPALAAAATACCAFALAPLRSRIQLRVDRRFNPRRHTLRAAIGRLRADVDSGNARPEDLEATLASALGDPMLRVGYRLPGESELTNADGRALVDVDGAVNVVLGDTRVGAIVPGTGDLPRHLLAEAAVGSAVLVELIRSRLQIRAALAEVAASRTRLLRVGYTERTRLQRDLHDGAQQRLVSLGVTLRLAQRRLNRNGPPDKEIDGMIDAAVAELGTAVAELRAIAHGLRPAVLDSGLAPALESLTAALPIPVQLYLCPEPVPDLVATTAYYVASEALANIVKHADAASVDVRLHVADGLLSVQVIDDGRGGARPAPGSGLDGLADRVAAAGGLLTVTDRRLADNNGYLGGEMRGTVLEAVLPCAR